MQHQSECVPLNAIVQIPKLPTYSGDILEFKAFWDQFDGAVHRIKDFDNVTKFVHLKSCLSGEALQLANGLTVTAENYEDIQPQSKELLPLHDETNSQLLEIRALGRDIDTRDTKLISGFRMLLPRLTNLLPILTRTKWKEHRTKLADEGLTSKAFLYILSQRAVCMDHTDNLANRKTRSPPARQNIRRQIQKHTTIDPLHSSITPKCSVCRGNHRLPNCKQFLSQGLEERKKTARTLHLCFKSLQHGHRATDCKLKGWDNEKQPTQKKSLLEEKTDANANVLLTSTHGLTRIRFQTKRGIAHGAEGKQMTVNCLFDSAAERTLVREDVAQTLRIAGPIETITVKEVHGIHCHSAASRKIQLRLSPLKSHPHEGVNQPIEVLTLTKICNDISSVTFLSKDWKHLEQLHLPEERDMNLPIHILIDLDFYGRFFSEKILTVIEEYIRNGWVEEVTSQHEQNGKTWYLPHHAVYKTVDGELKCRVVFYGSAKYGSVSLNQCLETGPNLQSDLVGVDRSASDSTKSQCRLTLRECTCRLHSGWKTAILVVSCGATAYRTLRCECIALPVCFGLACYPYLAMNVIKAHAERNPEECDDIIKRALSNMNVDDLVMSWDEESEVAALIRRVPVFLRKGRFHLRKWASNRVDLLATLPRPEVCETGEREISKALGVYWLKDEDVITFRPPANSTTQSRTTNKQLLSLAAKVYDPLGFLAPFTVQVKMMC
ncbi:Tas retrotransposon peptidase A16 superfamily [Trichinella spiralis]|uniref:Tas retrotransposon peptidase A16 superfamily n=1 Tax=Trichinella spiralis TaxID=6334 RepID=UPI0001EFD3E7|nr:Tas retrotransposon peptidase A16 superfamily [Trichinella spiralis]